MVIYSTNNKNNKTDMKKTYESPVTQIVRMSSFEIICGSKNSTPSMGNKADDELTQDEYGYFDAE